MYLSVDEIVSNCELLELEFADEVTLSTLPQPTHEGRPMHLLRIEAGPKAPRHGLYIQAGIHAREWGTVDAVLHFVEQLLIAFRDNTGMTFGNHAFSRDDVQTALRRVELFILPCVNPDGRAFSMQPGDSPGSFPNSMWRKNRRDNGVPGCMGVDLNRNLDWLWDFRSKLSAEAPSDAASYCQGVFYVSDDVCDPAQTYHGDKPFSEPETQNIKSVLDDHDHIRAFVDVHGVLGKVMTPWADDEVQTSDPDQNFIAGVHDGKRGLTDALSSGAGCQNEALNADGAAYREFMHNVDVSRYAIFGTLQTDAIRAVRGTNYRTGTSYLEMYGMTGNANDYAYSRHIADAGLGKIDGYIYEFENIDGLGFQPPFEEPPGASDMIHIIRDVAAGLTSLLLNVDRIPIARCTPMPLDFARVRVGTTKRRNITFANRGVRAFDIGTVGVIGATGPFSVLQPSQTHLNPGEQATIPVDAAPIAVGPVSSRVAIEFAYPNETVRDVRIVQCSARGCTVAAGACVAPTFAPAGWLTCLGRLIVYGAIIIALAIFAWIPSVLCTIKQLMFRIQRCRTGNSDPCRAL